MGFGGRLPWEGDYWYCVWKEEVRGYVGEGSGPRGDFHAPPHAHLLSGDSEISPAVGQGH